eukprot:365535-Chlamydomonas_euryale.AAC.72
MTGSKVGGRGVMTGSKVGGRGVMTGSHRVWSRGGRHRRASGEGFRQSRVLGQTGMAAAGHAREVTKRAAIHAHHATASPTAPKRDLRPSSALHTCPATACSRPNHRARLPDRRPVSAPHRRCVATPGRWSQAGRMRSAAAPPVAAATLGPPASSAAAAAAATKTRGSASPRRISRAAGT